MERRSRRGRGTRVSYKVGCTLPKERKYDTRRKEISLQENENQLGTNQEKVSSHPQPAAQTLLCDETKSNTSITPKAAEGNISNRDSNASSSGVDTLSNSDFSPYRPQFETYDSDIAGHRDIPPIAAAILVETERTESADNADLLLGDGHNSICPKGGIGEKTATLENSDHTYSEAISNVHSASYAVLQTLTDPCDTSDCLATNTYRPALGVGNGTADVLQSGSIQFQQPCKLQQNLYQSASCATSNAYMPLIPGASSVSSQFDHNVSSEQSEQTLLPTSGPHAVLSVGSMQSQQTLLPSNTSSESTPVLASSLSSQFSVSSVPNACGMTLGTEKVNVSGSQDVASSGYLQKQKSISVQIQQGVTHPLITQSSVSDIPTSFKSNEGTCIGQQFQGYINTPTYSCIPHVIPTCTGLGSISNTRSVCTPMMPKKVTPDYSHLTPGIQCRRANSSSVGGLSPDQMGSKLGKASWAGRQSLPFDKSVRPQTFRPVVVTPRRVGRPPKTYKSVPGIVKKSLLPCFEQRADQQNQTGRGNVKVSEPSPSKKGCNGSRCPLHNEKVIGEMASRGVDVALVQSDELVRGVCPGPRGSNLDHVSSVPMVSSNQGNQQDQRQFAVPIATPIRRNLTLLEQSKTPERPPTVDLSVDIVSPETPLSFCCQDCNITFPSEDLLSHTCAQEKQQSPRRPYKCCICSAGFSTLPAQYSHYEHFHKIKMSQGDLAIPLVDLSKESIATSSFKNFIPLTNLPRVHGLLGAPILTFENLQEGILNLENSINAFFYLGPVKSLDSVAKV